MMYIDSVYICQFCDEQGTNYIYTNMNVMSTFPSGVVISCNEHVEEANKEAERLNNLYKEITGVE